MMRIKKARRYKSELVYPKLSYKLTGLFFRAHRELGRFRSERQYCDFLEKLFQKEGIKYEREFDLANISNQFPKGNRVDFLIEDKIIIEVKAKKFITKEDYLQVIRYLHGGQRRLGLIVNFRCTYLRPKRVLNSKLASLACN